MQKAKQTLFKFISQIHLNKYFVIRDIGLRMGHSINYANKKKDTS